MSNKNIITTALGSVEGELILLPSGLCVVVDSISGAPVLCIIESFVFILPFTRAVGKRVSVSGVIGYAIDGTPAQIIVDTIRVFPDEKDLPSAEEIRGILK